MRIGISSWTYSWNLGVAGYPVPEVPMTAMGLLEKAHELGAEVLQIADNLPLEQLTEEEMENLIKKAKEWKISLEAGTKGVRPERLKSCLKIAEQMGSPILRTLIHDEMGCPSLQEAEDWIREMLPELEEKKVILAIENHDFFPVKALAELIRRLNSPYVRICLDPVNNLAQGESTNDVFAALGPYTVNFHCKDYTIARKPSNLGFDVEGCPAGDGLLDLPRCETYFQCPDMSFVVELWTPWQETIEATCKREREWAERSVKNLKKLKGGSSCENI